MKRVLTYALVLLATLATVIVVTRRSTTSGSGASGDAAHAHGTASSTAGGTRAGATAQPVLLTPEQERRIGVTYAAAIVGPLEKEVRTFGEITFDETRIRTISAKVDGWIERLYVSATGQPLASGDPLLTLYSPMLVSAQEEVLLANRLRRDVGEGSTDAQQSAQDLLASARRRLEYWDIPSAEIAELERTGAVRRTLTLRSPASGFVLEKNVLAGQRIMAGDPLFTVTDLRTVWVQGEVFERDIADVRVGQTVHADFEALLGEHRMGRISYVYPTLDPETRTVRVRVVLPNGDLRLKPGMYATLRIVGSGKRDALSVPRSAVLSTGERHIVFVREADGRLQPREVALGMVTDERVEIVRGLSAGATVVASATFLVDAESNLGRALGSMGSMPGMEMTPVQPLPMPSSSSGSKPPKVTQGARTRDTTPPIDHSSHRDPRDP